MTTVTARHRSEGSSPMNTQTDTIPRMIIDLVAGPGLSGWDEGLAMLGRHNNATAGVRPPDGRRQG